jgi:3-oxoacyl-[acyl-carrier-protein] synthase-3
VEENRHNIVTENCFKYAVTNMADASELIMKRNNLTKDVDWLVPHQANKRIIDTASRMNLEESKVLMNIEKYGNYLCNITSSPMILNTYSKKGDTIILLLLEEVHMGFCLFKMGVRQK